MKQDVFAVVYHEAGFHNPHVWSFTDHAQAQRYFVAKVLSLITNYCRMCGTYDSVGESEIGLGAGIASAHTTEQRAIIVDEAAVLFNDWFPDDILRFVRVEVMPEEKE